MLHFHTYQQTGLQFSSPAALSDNWSASEIGSPPCHTYLSTATPQ